MAEAISVPFRHMLDRALLPVGSGDLLNPNLEGLESP